ncbi:Hypothetical predicted protein [Octopus vulgaris]|uniref:Secreted protein n=1 Tax=Octopus vulgaris TaxID=6645 RepID=A0AA36F7C7_OCTVU|nr:Hypothetical predicted protein [Octopus vulgaris]
MVLVLMIILGVVSDCNGVGDDGGGDGGDADNSDDSGFGDDSVARENVDGRVALMTMTISLNMIMSPKPPLYSPSLERSSSYCL